MPKQIRVELPDEVHKALRHRALEEETSLRALIVRLLTEAAERESK